MRKKVSKVTSILAIGLAVCVALTACSSAEAKKEEENTQSEATVANEEDTQSDATVANEGDTQPDAAEEEGTEKILIGLSEPDSGWPYISAYMNAFKDAVDQNPNVEAVILSADGDIQKQANDIDDLIVKDVDILLVCSLNGEAIVPSLAKANQAGIPILAVSNEPSDEGQAYIEGYAGPDDEEQGRIAARIMADALGGKGNVVIVEGTPGQSTTLKRSDGFRDELEKIAPDIEILAAQTANWDLAEAKTVTQAFLTKYGDQIDGVFAHDDNSGAAVGEAIRDANLDKEIIIVGTGGTQNGLNAIRSGLLHGTMMQSPTTDAQLGLKLAIEIVNGNKLEQKRNIIDMPIVTPDNVDEYEGEW